VVNDHEFVTGDFTRFRDFQVPSDRLRLSLEARLGEKVAFFDASTLALRLLGDSIYSNMLVLGAAWQQGLLPLTEAAILKAIEINGAKVAENQRAFQIGRWAMLHSDAAAEVIRGPEPVETQVDPVEYRAARLVDYQDQALADRFRALVKEAPADLRDSVAKGYFKLLAYKDEYEVARLHLSTARQVAEEFEDGGRISFHLAPPVLPGRDPDGRPLKREFGAWVMPVFRLLARMKGLRGKAYDPFGWLPERRAERAAIAEYEGDMREVLPLVTPATLGLVRELAELPLSVRGYGTVKEASAHEAATRRTALLDAIRQGGSPMAQAAE
jgi:indolepyruvate ferredoxin oxidoreductase